MEFAFLIRRTVDSCQDINTFVRQFFNSPPVLPYILADSETYPPAFYCEDKIVLSRCKNPEFIEYAVIRQKMLIIPGFDCTVMDNQQPVARLPAVVCAYCAQDDV